MLDSPLNSNAAQYRGSGMGKTWDRSAARARGSALSRDYRSTASALGLPDPSKVLPNCSPNNVHDKRMAKPLTSVTKSDFRAPAYAGHRNGYSGGFQPSVLNSHTSNDAFARNGQESSSLNYVKSQSSFAKDLPAKSTSNNSRGSLRDLDYSNPIQPPQFSWPTPTKFERDSVRDLKEDQKYYERSNNTQFPGQKDNASNYQGYGVRGDSLNAELAKFKAFQGKVDDYPPNENDYAQSSLPESEYHRFPKIHNQEAQDNLEAEKPYESHPPIDSMAPGYTKAAVKSAAANAVIPAASYSVGPGYTDNQYAAGIVRPSYGAPSRNWPGLPASDPSYPHPEFRIPPPEAGVKKLTWKDEKDQMEMTRLAPENQARYPGDAYAIPEDNFGNSSSAYVPSTFEQQHYPAQLKADHVALENRNESSMKRASKMHNKEPMPDPEFHSSAPDDPVTKIVDSPESKALTGLKKIQTTNQTYGSWVDDPYLRGREWWYKPTRFPLNKTFLSKFKEDAGIRS